MVSYRQLLKINGISQNVTKCKLGLGRSQIVLEPRMYVCTFKTVYRKFSVQQKLMYIKYVTTIIGASLSNKNNNTIHAMWQL